MTRPVASHRPQIGFLLNRSVRGTSVLSEVVVLLQAAQASVTVHLTSGNVPLPSSLFDAALVVQRNLGVLELTQALGLEQAGVRCCNRIAGTITAWDRALTIRTLTEVGVPVPTTVSVATWSDLVDRTNGQPVVVKAAGVTIGRGLGVLIAATGRLPPQAPFSGPYIVQDYVANDERDFKVYVAGRQARGLIKKRPPQQIAAEIGTPFSVDVELADLARRAGRALGLDVYGVDFVYGANGPIAVDVNPFPGFRGVPEAGALIANHLLALATGQEME